MSKVICAMRAAFGVRGTSGPSAGIGGWRWLTYHNI